MDIKTLHYYSENSSELTNRYDTVLDGINTFFSSAFTMGSKVLDVGCGNGRDLRYLIKMGFNAFGVDPCDEFISAIKKLIMSCMVELILIRYQS